MLAYLTAYDSNCTTIFLQPRTPSSGDSLAIDVELAVLSLNGALEAAVNGVVLEHVDLEGNHVNFGVPTER